MNRTFVVYSYLLYMLRQPIAINEIIKQELQEKQVFFKWVRKKMKNLWKKLLKDSSEKFMGDFWDEFMREV